MKRNVSRQKRLVEWTDGIVKLPFQAASILSSRWGGGRRARAVCIVDKAGFRTLSRRRSTDSPNLAAVSCSLPRTIRTFWPLSSSCGSFDGRQEGQDEKYENGPSEISLRDPLTGYKYLYIYPSISWEPGKRLGAEYPSGRGRAETYTIITCQTTVAQKKGRERDPDCSLKTPLLSRHKSDKQNFIGIDSIRKAPLSNPHGRREGDEKRRQKRRRWRRKDGGKKKDKWKGAAGNKQTYSEDFIYTARRNCQWPCPGWEDQKRVGSRKGACRYRKRPWTKPLANCPKRYLTSWRENCCHADRLFIRLHRKMPSPFHNRTRPSGFL